MVRVKLLKALRALAERWAPFFSGATSVFMLHPPPVSDEEALARDMDVIAKDFEDIMGR